MERIDFPEGPNPFAPLPQHRNEAGKKTGKGKATFRTSIAKALEQDEGPGGLQGTRSSEFSEGPLAELLDAVHAAGEKLKEKPGVDEVQSYKKAVRDFVHHIVDHAWSVEKKTSGGSILKRKEFYRVAVIDESLERLAAEILRNQRDRLEILRRIDEINGMIVDLLR